MWLVVGVAFSLRMCKCVEYIQVNDVKSVFVCTLNTTSKIDRVTVNLKSIDVDWHKNALLIIQVGKFFKFLFLWIFKNSGLKLPINPSVSD